MVSSRRFIPLPVMLLLCLSILAIPSGAGVYPPQTPVTLTLQPGWNLVSIPYYLSIFKNTPVIFDEADEQGHSLFMFNGETRQWYIPGRERIFRPTDSIWVYTARSFTVTLDPFPENYSGVYYRPLYPGWNLVGITGDAPPPSKICVSRPRRSVADHHRLRTIQPFIHPPHHEWRHRPVQR